MGAIRPAPAAKLICGILAVDEAARARAVELLNREFGHTELRSAVWPFTWTDYYEDEMGPELLRQFVAFSGRFAPETIVAVKIAANRMESGLAVERGRRSDRRPVNLDPGYVTEAQVKKLTKRAGFRFVASSEVNANPKDTADHPMGVWTLPPTLRLGDKDRQKYVAIGESDRMTLKFIKPKKRRDRK